MRDVGHQFGVSYEVMDRRGQWYSVLPVSVYADPGDERDNVRLLTLQDVKISS
jgi:hypothetical protein